jgi:hypothetical protein
MKPYILGAIIVWFLCGFGGAVLLRQQRLDDDLGRAILIVERSQ